MKTSYIPQAKMLRVFDLIQSLNKPRTINQLCAEIDHSPRTVYRYMALLEYTGFKIVRRNNKYSLDPEVCPEFIKVFNRK